MADCRQTLKELELFLDGELPEAQRGHVLAHLDECMECYHTYDLQAELRSVIAKKCSSEALPPGLLERINQALSNETT